LQLRLILNCCIPQYSPRFRPSDGRMVERGHGSATTQKRLNSGSRLRPVTAEATNNKKQPADWRAFLMQTYSLICISDDQKCLGFHVANCSEGFCLVCPVQCMRRQHRGRSAQSWHHRHGSMPDSLRSAHACSITFER